MPAQLNITKTWFSNFLAEGAFVRSGEFWVLYLGPLVRAHASQVQGEVSSPAMTDSSIISPPFYHQQCEPFVYQPLDKCKMSTPQIRALLEQFIDDERFSICLDGQVAHQEFWPCFQEIHGRILSGEIVKGVGSIVHRFQKVPTRGQRARMILELTKAPQTLYPFGFWTKQEGILGATPEVLFECHGKILKTMALAGTSRDGNQNDLTLLENPKERQEHQLVVDDLKSQLSRLGNVRTDGPKVLRLPGLQHLRTDIEVELNEMSQICDMINQLHPTPALGVAPRSYGYQWLNGILGQNGRNRFGAPLCYTISANHHLCLVAIRCLQWSESESFLGVGCGIVKDSLFENEWNELQLKASSVLRVLDIGVVK